MFSVNVFDQLIWFSDGYLMEPVYQRRNEERVVPFLRFSVKPREVVLAAPPLRSQQLAGMPPAHPGACPPLLGSTADGAFGRSSCEIRSPPQPS